MLSPLIGEAAGRGQLSVGADMPNVVKKRTVPQINRIFAAVVPY